MKNIFSILMVVFFAAACNNTATEIPINTPVINLTADSFSSARTLPVPVPVDTEVVEAILVEYIHYDEQGYFALDYPKGFDLKIKELEYKGDSDPRASNRAFFFTDAKKEITFFAYPVYDKTINEGIELDKSKEVLVSNTSEKSGSKERRVVVIKAKDGSYERKYIDANGNICGTQYKNMDVLKRYEAALDKFTTSLEVFAD